MRGCGLGFFFQPVCCVPAKQLLHSLSVETVLLLTESMFHNVTRIREHRCTSTIRQAQSPTYLYVLRFRLSPESYPQRTQVGGMVILYYILLMRIHKNSKRRCWRVCGVST